MPIHTSFKSLVKGMKKQYKGMGKTVCRDFTDKTKICASKKAWQVFYSYLNKNRWDETKPMPTKHGLIEMVKLSIEEIIRG